MGKQLGFFIFAILMQKRHSYILFMMLSISLLFGCSGYERALKSKDVNYKLKKANEFYDRPV